MRTFSCCYQLVLLRDQNSQNAVSKSGIKKNSPFGIPFSVTRRREVQQKEKLVNNNKFGKAKIGQKRHWRQGRENTTAIVRDYTFPIRIDRKNLSDGESAVVRS